MSDDSPTVRPARTGEALSVRRILDAAVLEVDALDRRLEAGDVLVATDDGRILGAVVLEPRDRGAFVSAVAVRRRRRDRGIGTALLERALAREGRLVAQFDADVRPFYESLGFSIERLEGGRYRGERK